MVIPKKVVSCENTLSIVSELSCAEVGTEPQLFPIRVVSIRAFPSRPLANRDFTELFEGGFEVFDDLLGNNIGIEIIGFFEAFVSQPGRSGLALSRFTRKSTIRMMSPFFS
jgi:hypothetical protein